MTKQERIEHAKAWYEDVKERLAANTKASIDASTIYDLKNCPAIPIPRIRHWVSLQQTDSVSCAFNCKKDDYNYGKIAILNFASYKNPGGFFLGGSSAQEEALCHESNLYPILLAFEENYYVPNRKNLNKALYTNRAIYSPNVVFEHNGEQCTFDVITCAAPNFGVAHRFDNITKEANEEVFASRMKFLRDIALGHNVDTLIVGAWGCGVFQQDPALVANLICDILTPAVNVICPIPDDKNYYAFAEAIDGV